MLLIKKKKFCPHTIEELRSFCRADIPLWQIELSPQITDLSSLFKNSTRTQYGFLGLSEWDFSNVEIIDSMFEGALFFDMSLVDFNFTSVKSANRFLKNACSYSHSLNGVEFPSIESAYEALMGTPIEYGNAGGLYRFAFKDHILPQALAKKSDDVFSYLQKL